MANHNLQQRINLLNTQCKDPTRSQHQTNQDMSNFDKSCNVILNSKDNENNK
jgi:hypothetical protein